MWVNNNIELEIQEGVKREILFKSVQPLPPIKRMKQSCNCTAIKQIDKNTISVIFTAKKTPKHLRKRGYYFTYKHIEISFEDGTRDFLTFKAKITNVIPI